MATLHRKLELNLSNISGPFWLPMQITHDSSKSLEWILVPYFVRIGKT